MATADISKEAVFDGRIVQLPARYAVDKGALSLTNSPYDAIAANANQHTYNINVPSQNVFVDRALQWSSGVFVRFNVTLGSAGAAAGSPLVVFGRDVALAPFPLHQLVNTATATINDTSVTINTDTVLMEILRLVDYKKYRLSRTCPTMLDKFKLYGTSRGGAGGINTPLADYLSQSSREERPNGAWWDIVFVDPNTNTPLANDGTYNFNNGTGAVQVTFRSGVPVADGQAYPAGGYPLCIRFRSTENLVLSPFIFSDPACNETGLFGINNIQIVFNLKASIDRILRCSTNGGPAGSGGTRTISRVELNGGANARPFENPRINVQYLTPSLDLPLPPKSVVPYMEYPRYLTTLTGGLAVGSNTVSSQTIVLPQIPDMLLIYCKPNTYTNQEGDYYFPITRISVNFDNFAGLLSSHTPAQLYEMSVHNGLEMDYDDWSGLAVSATLGAGVIGAGAGLDQPFRVQTAGGFLVLKPGQDITLQSGQAPGLIGNFTLQFTCDVQNYGAVVPAGGATLYVIAVNSGFFETLAGSSRIVKGVLSEADIISAEPAPEGSREGLNRLVGMGFMDKLGSFLSRAKDVYSASKPAISAIKSALPEEGKMGKVKGALGAVGYGMAGAGPAGGAKKSLSARLM